MLVMRDKRFADICRRASLILLLFFPLSGAGCISDHYRYNAEFYEKHEQQQTPQKAISKCFEYASDTENPITAAKRTLETETHASLLLTIRSSRKDALIKVKARYSRSKASGKKKLVVILPIYGGGLGANFPTQALARTLAGNSSDTNVLRILGSKDFFRWEKLSAARTESDFFNEIDYSMRLVRYAIIDIRRFLDWAEKQPEIDISRVGIVGLSIGAFVAGVTMGIDTRVSAGVFVMGGGNPSEIFAFCKCDGPRETRKNLLKRFGWTPEMIKRKLSLPLQILNPTLFAKRITPKNILIIDAEYDQYIPRSARSALWEAMGRPERITFQHSHKVSFLSMTLLTLESTNRRINKFFEKRLQKMNTAILRSAPWI